MWRHGFIALCVLATAGLAVGCGDDAANGGEPSFVIGRVVLVPHGFTSRTTDLTYGYARRQSGVNAPIEVVLASDRVGCNLEARADDGYQIRFFLVSNAPYDSQATTFRMLEGTVVGVDEERLDGTSSVTGLDDDHVVGRVDYLGFDGELSGEFDVIICP